MKDEFYAGMEIRGRYVLKEKIGRGSFGDVWMAIDKVLNTQVAIKIYIRLDEDGLREFSREYKLASELHHDNLLSINYFDIWENCPFLVMKYCPNGAASVKKEQMSETDLWRFIRDVASGLAYLHAKEPPIIHQDIKPANILIDENNHYLISDFGISKEMRSTMRAQSKRHNDGLSGSICYLAPECFIYSEHVKASDIWALGVSIYELIHGNLPFMGQGGCVQKPETKMPVLPDGWSKDLVFVMQSCLAYNPWERPTAAELVEYASKILKGEYPDALWKKRKDSNPEEDEEDSNQNIFDPRATVKKDNYHKSQENDFSGKRMPRHGFVSFILKAGLILSLLMSLCSLIVGIIIASEDANQSGLLAFLPYALVSWGYYLLLKWKKWGFWIIWIVSFFVIYLSVYAFSEETTIFNFGLIVVAAFFSSMGMLVFYAILCLKKEGKSTWKQLDGKRNFLKEKEHKQALALIMILGIILFGYMLSLDSPLEREAKAYLDDYHLKVEECRGFTEEGSNSNVDDLIKAKKCMEKIVAMENMYSSVNSAYNCSGSLKPSLDGKLEDAYEAWVKAAESQYTKAKDIYKAINYYKKALSCRENQTARNRFVSMIKEVGYMSVRNVSFANSDKDGNLINDFGDKLYASQVKYLTPRITYDGLADESQAVTLYVKIFNPQGTLSHGTSSPSGYSYDTEVTVTPGTDNSARLTGWGNDNGGYYAAGRHRLEIWCENNKLYECTFDLK